MSAIAVTTKSTLSGYFATITVHGMKIQTRSRHEFAAVMYRAEDAKNENGTYVKFAEIFARGETYTNTHKSACRRFGQSFMGTRFVIVNLATGRISDSNGKPIESNPTPIVNTKESAMSATVAPTKTAVAKPNAKSQGFPAPYLGDTGNFKPGFDARAKSDIKAAISRKFTGRELVKLTKAAAEKLQVARGW